MLPAFSLCRAPQAKYLSTAMLFPESDIDPLAHAMEVLEFPKVKSAIASRCVSEGGRRHVWALAPIDDEELIRQRQELVEELRQLLATSGQPDLAGLSDPEASIDKATKEGVLTEEELWLISEVSAIVHRLTRIAANPSRFPRVRALLDNLTDTPAVHSNIQRFIAAPGVFKEDASEKLRQLRLAKKDVRERLQAKLEAMLEDERYRDFWQEPLITLRNERFVLPLKAEHKQHLPGVIHDRSASGATLFVEPLEIVPLNNQLRELELEEKAEKNRILRTLSGLVAAYAQSLLANLEVLHYLDFLVAVARFADEIGANQPSVAKGNPMVIAGARHPILLLERGADAVVPLDVDLPTGVKCIIITGPNMGGKTVALKTIGLLALMAACGLPVPAGAKTQLPLYRKFFADIGDEQSVEASLSSFASHIVHYRLAAEGADEESLVLFDELGSATDPQEGTPLAWALVEYLLERGATVVANTHLGGLVAFAAQRDDVANAAMEFDHERMEPTYRLLLGVPGKSWAVQTAAMLGLPKEILTRAQKLSEGGGKLDKLISNLHARLREVEDIRQRLREQEAELRSKRELLESLIAANRRKEQEISRLRRAYEEQRDARMVAAIQRELERIREEWDGILREGPPPRKRQRAEEFIARLKRRLRRAEREAARRRGMPKKLAAGQRVFVYRLHRWGDVVEPTDEQGFVKVLVGNMALRLHSSGVDTEAEYERKRRKKGAGGVSYRMPDVPEKLDVRGMSPEDAWDKVDRALDDAIAAEVEKILIVHGKGRGVLRRYIRDKLHDDPRVSRLGLPSEREGGDGATIAFIAAKDEDEACEADQGG